MNEIGKWRLPTIQELLSIVDYTKCNPATNMEGIKSDYYCYYWSSTQYISRLSLAWCVEFDYGSDGCNPKSYGSCVRCVRTLEDGSLEWAKEDALTKMNWYKAMAYAESLNVKTKEMTVGEIENILGYKVKIVKDKQ